MREKILQMLQDAPDYLSGEQISRELAVSRAAVWKVIQSLRHEGYPIESVKHHGYRLAAQPDILSAWDIRQALTAASVASFGQTIFHEAQVDSTNLAARRAVDGGAPDRSLFIADEQTAGRGRRGRQWLSGHRQGLWFSLLLRPTASPAALSRLTLFAGLCVTQAIRQLTGLEAAVKWPNDIVILPSGRKICGILTEMISEENQIIAIILGIGVNINNDTFAEPLTNLATSLRLETGQNYRRVEVLAAILKVFETGFTSFLPPARAEIEPNASTDTGSAPDFCEAPAWLTEYRRLCATLNRPVVIADAQGGLRQGQAVSLTDEGDLIVTWSDGSQTAVHAGEVSVRGLLGYGL